MCENRDGWLIAWGLCYTEKATPTRHRPERQPNARSNRRKQCSPNETKPYSKPTPPRKRQTCMGFVWVNAFSFFHCVASPFHSVVTPTTNPNDHQPAQLIDQAPGTIERALYEVRAVDYFLSHHIRMHEAVKHVHAAVNRAHVCACMRQSGPRMSTHA